jgi:hypothetical protein
VSGSVNVGTTDFYTASFCAPNVECDEPDFSDFEECPAGWVCGEVPQWGDKKNTRATCLPPDVKVCAPGELQ